MRFLVVTPAACIHERHQADPKRKGERHADNQCYDSMPANAFECAEGIAASKQQHCKGQDDGNGLMDVGTFHFIRDQPHIVGKVAPEEWTGGVGMGGIKSAASGSGGSSLGTSGRAGSRGWIG
jgi:hypothetical protein